MHRSFSKFSKSKISLQNACNPLDQPTAQLHLPLASFYFVLSNGKIICAEKSSSSTRNCEIIVRAVNKRDHEMILDFVSYGLVWIFGCTTETLPCLERCITFWTNRNSSSPPYSLSDVYSVMGQVEQSGSCLVRLTGCGNS